jgi:hypothetical protein
MKKLYTLVAMVLVLSTSMVKSDTWNVEDQPGEAESYHHRHQHKHHPHRGRLREKIHKARVEHHEEKMKEEKKHPKHRGRIRERMHERWDRKVEQEKNRNE